MEITRIDENNKNGFVHLIPEQFIEQADIAIGVVEDLTGLGVATAKLNEQRLLITGIFVAKPNRKQGVGTALVEQLIDLGISLSCTDIQLSFTDTSDEESQDLEKFLTNKGFLKATNQGTLYRIVFDKSRDLNIFEKLVNKNDVNIVRLKDITAANWSETTEWLEHSLPAIIINNRAFYDAENSLVAFFKAQPVAIFLIHEENGETILDAARAKNQEYKKLLLELIKQTIIGLRIKKESVLTNALSEDGKKLIDMLSNNNAKQLGKVITMVYELYIPLP